VAADLSRSSLGCGKAKIRSRSTHVSIGPAEGPGKLTRKQAERFAWDHFLAKIDNTALHPKSTMTLDEFWNAKFETQVLPKLKRLLAINTVISGRTGYSPRSVM